MTATDATFRLTVISDTPPEVRVEDTSGTVKPLHFYGPEAGVIADAALGLLNMAAMLGPEHMHTMREVLRTIALDTRKEATA